MKTSIIIGIVAIILIAGGIFLYSSSQKGINANVVSATQNSVSSGLSASTGSSNSVSTDANTKVIDINATRWSYTPGTITVKKGDHVKINVNSIDTTHGIYIPDLNVSGIDSVEFTADTAGTYTFRCPTFCGKGHREMTGTLIVQ